MTSHHQNQNLEKAYLDSYNLYSDAIFRFVLFKIDNRDRALELVQDTFMKTWIHLKNDGQIENYQAFLYKVAGNLVIDEYRKRERTDFKTDSLEIMRDEGFEPSLDEIDSMIDRIDGKEIVKVLEELPDIYRDIIYMKYSENLSIREMAEILEITDNAVSVRLNRGMKKLKEIMENKLSKFNQ